MLLKFFNFNLEIFLTGYQSKYMSTGIVTNNSVLGEFKNLGLDNPYQLVSAARKGIKPKVFYDFAQAINMPEKSLAGIINQVSTNR